MGRTILCPHCKSTFDEDILKKRNSEDTCPVCGESLLEGNDNTGHNNMQQEEHPDWITWYYYGYKSNNGKTACLEDKPIDLTQHGDVFFLIKEFKAPPRDSSGSSERAKEILRTYVPDAFVYTQAPEDVVRCPRCRSTEIQLVPRKFSLLTGFATNKVDRMCVRCGKRF